MHEILQSDKIASINLGRETKRQRKLFSCACEWKMGEIYGLMHTRIDDCDSQTKSKKKHPNCKLLMKHMRIH